MSVAVLGLLAVASPDARRLACVRDDCTWAITVSGHVASLVGEDFETGDLHIQALLDAARALSPTEAGSSDAGYAMHNVIWTELSSAIDALQALLDARYPDDVIIRHCCVVRVRQRRERGESRERRNRGHVFRHLVHGVLQ